MSNEDSAQRRLRDARLRAADLESMAGKITPLPDISSQELEAPATVPAPLRQEIPAFQPGEVLANRYRIVRYIARGGMGAVYEVEDQELRERIALKTIRPEIAGETGTVDRLKREIQLARRVTHRNVCRIFDIGFHPYQDANVAFLTMELLTGETLAAKIRRIKRFAPAEALPLALQIIDGLDAAHRAGIIHRDLKSANVILVEDPETRMDRPVITDFGLARGSGTADQFAPSVTGTGITGTPAYMAPEQVQGAEITEAADQYALGVVLYEMVTGVWPFQGDTPLTVAAKRLTAPAPPPSFHVPDFDVVWENTILRCLEKNVADRFDSVADVGRSLSGNEVPISIKSQRQNRRIRAIRYALLAVATALLVTFLFRNEMTQKPWVETFFDDFQRTQIGTGYVVSSGEWSIHNGVLVGDGFGPVNIDLAPRFAGDVRIEMDVRLLPESGKNEIAVFLVGNHSGSSNGYYFGLGADDGIGEIDRKGIEMVLTPSPRLEKMRTYKVVAERKRNRLEVLLDGQNVAQYIDPVPLNPAEFPFVRIGSYDGALQIDNLRVLRERVTEVLPATVPGDLHFVRGEFDDAKEEYERVVRDQIGKPIAGEALFKTGLCALELEQYELARKIFQEVASSPASSFYKQMAEINIGKTLTQTGRLENAFEYFAKLALATTGPEQQYRVANEILLLSNPFAAVKKYDWQRKCLIFVRDSFPALPIPTERAEFLLSSTTETRSENRKLLGQFLQNRKRLGKHRYSAQELFGTFQLLDGDFYGALSTYQQMEREYPDTNLRFSIRGVYGQAITLAAMKRFEESAAIGKRLQQQYAGNPFAERLFVEWSIFWKRLKGDLPGAISELEREVSTPHESARFTLRDQEQQTFDKLDLALLYEESGNKEKAHEMLTALNQDLPDIAALFLEHKNAAEFLSDETIAYDTRHIYAGEYFRRKGQLSETGRAYNIHLSQSVIYDAFFLSPITALAAAYLH